MDLVWGGVTQQHDLTGSLIYNGRVAVDCEPDPLSPTWGDGLECQREAIARESVPRRVERPGQICPICRISCRWSPYGSRQLILERTEGAVS